MSLRDMADKRAVARLATSDGGDQTLFVWCPACDDPHGARVFGGSVTWGWNGSLVAPTLTPSVLVYETKVSPRCHSFLTDGVWNYLGDCGHEMAGRQVPAPEWPEGWSV